MQKTRVQPPGLGRSPGESHGQKSLVGYSPWGHKESDTTERLTLSHLQEPRSFLSSFSGMCNFHYALSSALDSTFVFYHRGRRKCSKKVCTSMTHLKTFLKNSHHRLIYVLSSYAEALTQASQNVTLFGNKVFADMLVKRRSLG